MVKSTGNLPEPTTSDEAAIAHWLERLAAHYPTTELAQITAACSALAQCRGNQRIETGETHIRHILSTADILVQLQMDAETLVAALLNGCLNQSELTTAQLTTRFGAGIAHMVGDLARIGQLANVNAIIAAKDQEEHEENLRRLLLGIAEDVRVVLIVLAERMHLMRAIKHLQPEQRFKIARDTQRVYAPLANRLGIWQIKWELEDLSLRYLQPDEYKRIASLLVERRTEREHYIAAVIETLRTAFAEVGITAEITGRPKHIYSIWKKMRRKAVDIAEIFDLRAVRILVPTVADCYAALGLVHGRWKHIPKEFDDYIATPKGNFYQSLHTAVIGPEDKPLEVQIRTYDMHRHAEFGVAAHWAYKEAKGHDAAFQRRVVWMRNWLELKNEGDNASGILDRFKAEFEPVHIYVLTPQFKVIELPKYATPLDFAYAIHSEIGNRCRGARVNDRIVPLNQSLNSGDKVEILTQKNAAPSRDWLSPHHGYLTTARARNRVRQWFKQQHFDQHVQDGRAALALELGRAGLPDKARLDALAQRSNYRRGDELLAAIGSGDVAAGHIARQLEPKIEPSKDLEPRLPKPKTNGAARKTGAGDVVVEGVDDLMTQIAQCCKPVPYDDIIGFVTRGRGVTIHRKNCHNLRHLPPAEAERLLQVRWATQPTQALYPVDLFVIAADRKGLLRDVSSVFSDADVDVVGVNTHSDRSTACATMHFIIEIKNMQQLGQLNNRLQQIPDVLEVRRS
ncbi:RelA/SpoT family protein [Chromatium okenii]|jgi:GTP pyrophosphokinase|uniref:GTP pyrophosphokinase n=1 Tax=Chromatium okenii TaxID=61644 RepID=A0A2S7XQ66_9GAMM|nr:bifunctional (p)ppGpp synthetase/guanosine-3',5'-bis(diphosphate) 3'-pyrophosphohydrolase [Chromatium okenii]PQJ95870.1 GTP diphosphokinase [Chromatium okenii]